MISFDFDYYKPDSIKEAMDLYNSLAKQNTKAIFYAGGTEIISQARVNKLQFNAVIDIKSIPECTEFGFKNDKLIIGAAATLTKISDSGLFPFLGESCRKSADHTARDKITLGGNICGKIPYRETLLPLLLTDSEALIASTGGMKTLPVTQVFNNGLQLNNGELLVQIIIDKSVITLPYMLIKKTKQEKVDYPLVTAAVIKKGSKAATAFSGLCPFAFKSEIEFDLNNSFSGLENTINIILSKTPAPILADIISSTEFRRFTAGNVLEEACRKLKE